MSQTDQNLTPLAILLASMHRKWTEGDEEGAVKIARLAAPYLHPRRAAITHSGRLSLEPDHLTDAELTEAFANARTGTAGTRVCVTPAHPPLADGLGKPGAG
jgi:hypothetical protein